MTNTLTDFAHALNLAFGPYQRKPQWPPSRGYPTLPRAFVMTDTERLSDPISIINYLPQDIAVIFRHYNHARRQRIAHQLVNLAHSRGLKVLISGDLKLARQTSADGVHLPSHLLGTRHARLLTNTPPYWMITAAIHSRWDLWRATKLNIDAILVSPVYETTTQVQRQALGPIGLRRLTCASLIPVFALGGLNLSALPRLKNTGAVGFAGIGEFLKFI